MHIIMLTDNTFENLIQEMYETKLLEISYTNL